ncbi:MAG TPA: ArsR family transcriptional regulator [Parvularcula sp.]|nr:ArsR family transcriptional regulator [Parvularcula sp.]
MPRPASLSALQSRAEEVARLLKSLSHPVRLLAVCELMKGERSVGALEAATGAPQPTLSRDLARLRREGIVKARRQSKSVYYRLSDARAARMIDALCVAFGPETRKKRSAR